MKHSIAPFKLSNWRPNLVLATLLIAGVVVKAPVHGQEDAVLAKINDFELRTSDVNLQISTMPLGDQVTIRSDPEKFVESLIQEEVLFQYALQHELSHSEAFRAELKTIAVNHLIEKYVTEKLEVSDAEIEAYYRANESAIRGETIQVSQILTQTREECESILAQLQQGGSFEDLATSHSIHESSAANGGFVGSMMNHEGPLGFEEQLFEIPENEYTLFESADGCHLVSVNGRNTPPLPPVENVAPALENLLLREKEIEALNTLFERAHREIEVIRPESSQSE